MSHEHQPSIATRPSSAGANICRCGKKITLDPSTGRWAVRPKKGPSPREVAQTELVAHLLDHGDYWNAPFGVIESLRPLERGAVRTVTFGVARYLDATAFIWSADRIEVKAEGGLAHRVEGHYGSVREVISHLSPLYGYRAE